jgi:glycerol-3-phosphate acyltransferase PlsY
LSSFLQIAIVIGGFFCGSLPFSVWIGRLALREDIRRYGDGNPGAFNVFRAGGKAWGWLAIVLDFLKAAIPVGIANLGLGMKGWALVAAAAAPLLGHAFSPFLGWKGGKGLAAAFGAWSGLSIWLAPAILGGLLALGMGLLKKDTLAVLAGQTGLLVALLILRAPWEWLAFWGASSGVFLIKFRDPKQLPS